VSERSPEASRTDLGTAIGAVARGMGTIFKQVFRKDVTEAYPKVITQPPPRSHIGRHRLNTHEDGLEKCIGCELCAYACPADAIWVEGADNDPEHPTSPGERYAANRPSAAPCRKASNVPPYQTSAFGLSRSARSCA